MGRPRKYDKPGRPVTHDPVLIVELGEIVRSYAEAAVKVGGNRGNILLCLLGDRQTHMGCHYEYVNAIKGESNDV